MVSRLSAPHEFQECRIGAKGAFKLLPGKRRWFSASQQVERLAIDVADVFWTLCLHDFALIDLVDLGRVIVVPNYNMSDLPLRRFGEGNSSRMIVVIEQCKNSEVLTVTEHRRVQFGRPQFTPDDNGTVRAVLEFLSVQTQD